MRLLVIATIVCAVSAAQISVPTHDDTSDNVNALNRRSSLWDKIGINKNPKLDALKETAKAMGASLDEKYESAKSQVLTEAQQLVEKAKAQLRAEYGLLDIEPTDYEGDAIEVNDAFMDFGDAMRSCDKRDCKSRYFIKETVRWIKKALVDMGILIYDNPVASAALFIGVSVLIANIASGGGLVSLALEAVGFGSRGPIAGSVASLLQKQLGSVNVGSVFAQLQSAAMGGVAMGEIQKMATIAFAGLGMMGATGLVGAGTKSLGQTTDFEPAEWRNWEVESKVDYSAEVAERTARLWGPFAAESCVAYGYREYRAPIWFVPNGKDPVGVCLQTPAAIQGIGFKTPLGCADEGPKKGVIATWYVHSNETQCMPRWSELEDEGCMQYGRRRTFARLLGLRRQDDWNNVCESTPARVRDTDYDGPTYCEDKGILGIYGIFDIPDTKCECYCGGA